jgi:hypothetical protein
MRLTDAALGELLSIWRKPKAASLFQQDILTFFKATGLVERCEPPGHRPMFRLTDKGRRAMGDGATQR